MKIAAAYIRVSTNDQTEYSPESQIELLREYAKKNDMILPDEFIFRDDGISGRTAEKRPEFMRMIGTAKIKPKPFETILLWKFSRFARNREDAILYKSMLRKNLGINVVSISENIGDDKMSVLIEAMIEAMDEYYSINLSEEVKRGMTERVKRGEVVSVAPFGYKIENKQLVVDDVNASSVKLIYADFLNGYSMTAIAKKLNNLGVRTARGNNFLNRTIRYILTNPIYCGRLRWSMNGANDYYHGTWNKDNTLFIDGVHEAIISKEVFEEVQAKLIVHLKRYESYNAKRQANVEASKNGDFMLRGVVKCSNCGSTMSRSDKGLNCCSYAHSKCGVSHYISFNIINALVLNALETDMQSLNFEIVEKKASIEVTNDNQLVEQQIKKLNNVLYRHKEAYANGIDTLEEYKQNKANITFKIKALEKQLAKTEPKKINKKQFAKEALKNITLLKSDKIDETQKNTILRSFVDKIVFNRKKTSIAIFYYI